MTLIFVLSATMQASTVWNMNSLEWLPLKDLGKIKNWKAQLHVGTDIAQLLDC